MRKYFDKYKYDKKIMWVMIIILCCLYFLRAFNLEQDLPPWEIGHYQPADEGAYCFWQLIMRNLERFHLHMKME